MSDAARDRRSESSSLSLRVIHALIFVGLSSAAMAVGSGELRQLLFVLTAEFHFGNPPSVLPILGAAFGAVAALAVLFHFARARSAPLWVSVLPLVGLSLGVLGRSDDPVHRTHFAANLDVLAAARQLHRHQVSDLQRAGEISSQPSSWEATLAALGLPKSPARTRSFDALPFQVKMTDQRNAALVGRPGTLFVWVSADGAEFDVRAIGFDEHRLVAPLRDSEGKIIVLTGAYNPEMKEPEAQKQPQVAPSPWDLPSK